MHHEMSNRYFLLFILFLVPGFSGCGSDHHGGMDDLSTANVYLQALDQRLESHFDTVQGILEISDRGIPGTADLDSLSDSHWEELRIEYDAYREVMHEYMNAYGGTMAMFGNCRMRAGGVWYGPEGSFGSCPCQPYLNRTETELDSHLSDMFLWMELEAPGLLRTEMDRHRSQMRFHLDAMTGHMQQHDRRH